MSATQTDIHVLTWADSPSDRFIASIITDDPKLRAMLAIMWALSLAAADE